MTAFITHGSLTIKYKDIHEALNPVTSKFKQFHKSKLVIFFSVMEILEAKYFLPNHKFQSGLK